MSHTPRSRILLASSLLVVACPAPEQDPANAGYPGGPCLIGVCYSGECVDEVCVGDDEAGDSSESDTTTGDGEGETTSTGDGDGDTTTTTTTGDDDDTTTTTTTGDGDGDEVVGATQVWTSNIGVIPADLEFNGDDTLIASAGYDAFDGDFTIWSVAAGVPLAGPMPTAIANPAVTWSPTSDRVAGAGHVDGFRIYDADGNQLASPSDCQAQDTSALAWHPTQELMLVGGAPGFGVSPTVCLRNLQTNQNVGSWQISDQYAIHDVVWSSSGARFAALASCVVTVFDTASATIINEVQLDFFACEYGERLAWRPGTQDIAVLGRIDQDYVMAMVNATQGVPAYLDIEAVHLAYSPDGSKLALIGRTGTVWVLDAGTFDLQHQFKAHNGLTLAIAWSHDGQLLATGGETPRLALWQLEYAG